MNYEIQSNNDLLSGASLTVRIPENELDRKALYTIQEDRPDFMLPFRHRVIDGQIEFVYQIDRRSKLQYLAGDRHPKEYAELWSGVLDPLLECDDWFLRPYSFVLDINYLYCDKHDMSISYVYIPSMHDYSDYHGLKEMAADFSRRITVTDPDLENKVLRSIMLDFNPKTFLQMLKPYAAEYAPMVDNYGADVRSVHIPAQPKYALEPMALPMPGQGVPGQGVPGQEGPVTRETSAYRPANPSPAASRDIIIDIPADMKPVKSAYADGGGFHPEPAYGKKDKRQKNGNSAGAGGVSGKKKDSQKKEVAEVFPSQPTAATASQRALGETVDHLMHMPVQTPSGELVSITQNLSYEANGAWLRLIGNASLPSGIEIPITEGEVFTIGRFDSAAGRQQSSFEFDKMTKAVSRRHAAIERHTDGYCIIDLSSSAGTFIDSQKLPPNTLCKLRPGNRVSFGNCGADYVWVQ